MKSDHKKDAIGDVALRTSDKIYQNAGVSIANSKVGVNRVKEAEAWVGNLIVTGGDMVETHRVAKSAEVSLEMAETSEHGGAQAAGDLRNGRMKI